MMNGVKRPARSPISTIGSMVVQLLARQNWTHQIWEAVLMEKFSSLIPPTNESIRRIYKFNQVTIFGSLLCPFLTFFPFLFSFVFIISHFLCLILYKFLLSLLDTHYPVLLIFLSLDHSLMLLLFY